MELIDSAPIDELSQDVAARLTEDGVRVLVEGPLGSGRTILLQRLAASGAIVADAPPLGDPDAPLHALLQLADPLGRASRAVAEDGRRPLSERAREIAEELAARKQPVAIRLPSSWRLRHSGDGSASADTETWRRGGAELLEGLLAEPKLRVVLLLVSRSDLDISTDDWVLRRLPRSTMRPEALRDLSPFGEYEAAAVFIAALCRGLSELPSPVQFQVAVALRALGHFADRDVDLLEPGPGFELENRLVRALVSKPGLGTAAYRVALARRPVPTADAVAISGVDPAEQPLVTHCLTHGSGKTMAMHERIRSAVLGLRYERRLRDALRSDALCTHHRYAQLHAKADGTSSVLDSPSAVDWLERVHHLASSGSLGEAEWEQLSLNSRELYWARGRALSLAGQHVAAAKLYQRCLELFGEDDAYAQHYRGFNLDRAGASPDEAVSALRKAVQLDPSNPWWNARLVTTLIDQAKYLAARRAWRDALLRVDPNGDRVTRDGWLAMNLHRWVVRAWLDQGEVDLAREAFDAIPTSISESEEGLRLLELRLLDAEEARDLGESVYPAAIAPSERWSKPRHVRDVNAEGSPLQAWYPGRVVSADDNGVLIVFAIPDPDPDARRVKHRELAMDEWNRLAQSRPEGFIEIGTYVDTSVVILPVDDPRADWAEVHDVEFELRYLGGWAAER